MPLNLFLHIQSYYIQKMGFFKGFFMAIYRILRCNPFSKGGYDPVPEKKEKHKHIEE